MTQDPNRRPSTNQPLGGPPRKRTPAVVAVVGLVVAVLAIIALITWLRYNT